jgi:ketosteroid isomerase-like protein
MAERPEVERLVKELHAARIAGDLERLCAVFAPDARLRIAGTSDGKPIAIDASRIARIRPWLSILVRTFRLTGYQLLSLTIEGEHAAAHWRVDIESKITGISVPTELVDLIEVGGKQITSYVEFFVPC